MLTLPNNLPVLVLIFMLPFIRISAMMMALPIIGTPLVPAKVRLILSLSVTLIVVLSQDTNLELLQRTPFILLMLSAFFQILIGVTFGLIIHIIFQAFIMAGQVIAMQMGLGFASLVDPQSNAQVPAIGQIYSIIAMLLYLSMNGHLFIINAIIQSFEIIPVMSDELRIIHFQEVVNLGALIFSYGLKIALPAVIALLVTNIAFGVISKSAPQVNIFTLGFSISLIIGIFLIWLTFPFVVHQFIELCEGVHDHLFSYFGVK